MDLSPFIQYGALGVLALVLYFGGKIVADVMKSQAENQKTLIDGVIKDKHETLESSKTLAAAVESLQKATQSLITTTSLLVESVDSQREESRRHQEKMEEGMRRMGAFRPSAGEMPAVRAEGSYRGREPGE